MSRSLEEIRNASSIHRYGCFPAHVSFPFTFGNIVVIFHQLDSRYFDLIGSSVPLKIISRYGSALADVEFLILLSRQGLMRFYRLKPEL
jgi:hypothetical protein